MKFFRPNSNSIEVDSGIYSANDVNIHLCFNRAKRSDPMMLIDKMMQRLDSLDLNISIALGNILSEKNGSKSSDSEDAIESCERKIEKRDVGLNAETIFKKLNEVERKMSDALR